MRLIDADTLNKVIDKNTEITVSNKCNFKEIVSMQPTINTTNRKEEIDGR